MATAPELKQALLKEIEHEVENISNFTETMSEKSLLSWLARSIVEIIDGKGALPAMSLTVDPQSDSVDSSPNHNQSHLTGQQTDWLQKRFEELGVTANQAPLFLNVLNEMSANREIVVLPKLRTPKLIRVNMKDTGALDTAIENFVDEHALDEDDGIMMAEKIGEVSRKWFRYSEYLTVEIDISNHECRVVEVSR